MYKIIVNRKEFIELNYIMDVHALCEEILNNVDAHLQVINARDNHFFMQTHEDILRTIESKRNEHVATQF